MPSGSIAIVAFLALGYVLFIVELVVPGGILGILGFLSVAYGCYLAFDLGFAWGAGSIAASVVVFAAAVYFMLKSKTGRHMTLADEDEGRTWKSADQSLGELMGEVGVATTPLRPAGVALFGDRRVDVVSDSEFLVTGTALQVIEVEGNRVVVEAVADQAATEETATEETATQETATQENPDAEPTHVEETGNASRITP